MSTLIYDLDCGFCTACARFAEQFLALDADIQPGVPDELVAYGVDRGRFAFGIPFVTDAGHLAYGALAVGLALRTSRLAPVRWAGGFVLSPLVRPLAHRVYGVVARNRYRLPGSNGSCRVH